MSQPERERFEWPECILTLESDWGGLIHFVPDDVAVDSAMQGVVYRASEIERLLALELSQEDLRTVHQVKKILGVSLEAASPRPKKLRTEDEVADAWAGWSVEQRERYLELRLRALRLLDVSEADANLEQRTLAASWAADRVLGPASHTQEKAA